MSKSKINTLSPKSLVSDGMQVRVSTNGDHVDDILSLFTRGGCAMWPETLEPIVVFWDGAAYYLADGHHRLAAAIKAGCKEVRVIIKNGTRDAALWFAIRALAAHQVLKRTYCDKRRMVLLAKELSPSLTNRAIAKQCRVSHTFVNQLLGGKPSKSSNASIGPSAQDEGDIEPTEKSVNASAKPGENPESIRETESETGNAATPPSERGSGNIENKAEPEGSALAAESLPPNEGDAGPLASKTMEALSLFGVIDQCLGHIAKKIDQVGHLIGGELFRTHCLKLKSVTRGGVAAEHLYSRDLENLRRELAYWRPYKAICPICRGKPSGSCQVCQGLPYVIRAAWDRVPEKQRQGIE